MEGVAATCEACSNHRMRVVPRASAIGVLGIGLSIVSVTFGQGQATPVRADTKAESNKPEGSGSPERGVSDRRGGDARAVDVTKGAGAVGGYSWSKKAHPRSGKRPAHVDPKRPLVQAPNFLIRADGTSVVSLALSRTLPVSQRTAGHRVEYLLKGAQVGIENNLNPLVTEHFVTPLVRAVLRRDKAGLVLVLQLREDVRPVYAVHESPTGSATLEITLPKANATSPRGNVESPNKSKPHRGKPPRAGQGTQAETTSGSLL